MRWLVLLLLFACKSSAVSHVPPGKGAVGELEFFVGDWHVEAKNPQSGKAFTFTYAVEPILRGRWYRGTGVVASLDLEIHDVWGKDAQSGEIVRTIFDSAQTFGTVRSKGWQGDKLVLEGDASSTSGPVHVRETITRKGPDEFEAVWESRDGETWSAYSIERLRRQGTRRPSSSS